MQNNTDSQCVNIYVTAWIQLPCYCCLQGRLYRVRRLFRHLEFNLAVSFIFTTLLRNFTIAFYLVNWAGCIFWYIARQEGFGADSWVGRYAQQMDMAGNKSTFERYIYSGEGHMKGSHIRLQAG